MAPAELDPTASEAPEARGSEPSAPRPSDVRSGCRRRRERQPETRPTTHRRGRSRSQQVRTGLNEKLVAVDAIADHADIVRGRLPFEHDGALVVAD